MSSKRYRHNIPKDEKYVNVSAVLTDMYRKEDKDFTYVYLPFRANKEYK